MAESPTALVLSCDERYAFLLRGLVLSLAEFGLPSGDVRIVLIDIGCSAEMVAWLRGRNVEVVTFSAHILPQQVLDVVTPSQWAQVLRPWIPDILVGFETFIWVDADIWFQSDAFVDLIRTALAEAPDAIVAAPGMSHYGTLLYEQIGFLRIMQLRWFEACCHPDFAARLADRLHFSSGLFGMRRGNPIWAEWKRQIASIYPAVVDKDPEVLHLAEQTALNIILLMNPQAVIRLDPLLNFHCNGGGAGRDLDGRVKTSLVLPRHVIGGVHLANWSLLKEHYVAAGLLYRRGEYLSHTEWAVIRGHGPDRLLPFADAPADR